MTTQENQTEPTPEQIADHRTAQINAQHPASWVWDENAISFVPPIPLPTDGKPYLWDEESKSFVPFPGFPTS